MEATSFYQKLLRALAVARRQTEVQILHRLPTNLEVSEAASYVGRIAILSHVSKSLFTKMLFNVDFHNSFWYIWPVPKMNTTQLFSLL